MSERWIKICHETRRKPEVIQIARRLGLKGSQGRRVVVGTLVDMWILFDEQTTDGHLSGFSLDDLDAEIDCPGFAEAVAAVGWLEVVAEGLVMPHFDEHTSQSAKTRASDNRRKRISRMAGPEKCPDVDRTKTGPDKTRPDKTRPDKTRKERNGTKQEGEPSRADGVSQTKSKGERGGVGPLSDPANETPADRPGRPASVKLHQLAKSSPLLQELERRPVTGSGVMWHGSVFSRDRLRPDHIQNAASEFWLTWYQNQLSATAPELRCGNQAEAAFVLAAVFAARRIPDAKVKASRIAVWICWVKDRECSGITLSDFRRAAEIVVRHFGGELPEVLSASAERQQPAAEIPKPLPAEQRTKRSFRESIKKLKTAEGAST